MPREIIRLLVVAPLILGAGLGVSGCRGAGRFLGELFRERPPAPLDSMSVASDVRIDSLGYLVGSFVGEGTSRAVHLLSSDTGLVAGLVRRYRPRPASGRTSPGGRWRARASSRWVQPAAAGQRARAKIERAMVGSPLGQTGVVPRAILLRGSPCGWRGAQVEIIVDHDRGTRGPPLRGPVLGSLTRGRLLGPGPNARVSPAGAGRATRSRPGRRADRPHRQGHGLRARRPLPVTRCCGARPIRGLEINTLSDVDAADVISFRSAPDRVRFAVSLRERRITAGDDTLLAATVMAWDSAGAWQQTIFRPTLLSFRRGRLAPYGALRRSIFWRRLQPISDFGFERDNLWMEQVDVAERQRALGNHPAGRQRGRRRGRSGGALPMKIYTRTGDAGETGAVRRRPGAQGSPPRRGVRRCGRAEFGHRPHPRHRAGGALRPAARVDPARPLFHRRAPGHPDPERVRKALEKATLSPERVSEFERVMDEADQELQPLKAFVLPAGTPKASALHLAPHGLPPRRAERGASGA